LTFPHKTQELNLQMQRHEKTLSTSKHKLSLGAS
jgi:hypothetical protein